jgi:hypothetical protein
MATCLPIDRLTVNCIKKGRTGVANANKIAKIRFEINKNLKGPIKEKTLFKRAPLNMVDDGVEGIGEQSYNI